MGKASEPSSDTGPLVNRSGTGRLTSEFSGLETDISRAGEVSESITDLQGVHHLRFSLVPLSVGHTKSTMIHLNDPVALAVMPDDDTRGFHNRDDENLRSIMKYDEVQPFREKRIYSLGGNQDARKVPTQG